jgi:hypothetical protein
MLCPESGPATGAGPSDAGVSENVIATTAAAANATKAPCGRGPGAIRSLGRLRGRLDLARVGHVDRGSRGDVAGRPAEHGYPRLAHAVRLPLEKLKIAHQNGSARFNGELVRRIRDRSARGPESATFNHGTLLSLEDVGTLARHCDKAQSCLLTR